MGNVQCKIGDVVRVNGRDYVIAEITYQDFWERGADDDGWMIEFIDNKGAYHYWKSYSKQKSNAKYKIEVKRNLMNAVDRLKEHPKIYNADGIEMIKKVKNQSETQLFVDWPYVGLYRSSSKLYQTEMAGLYDHIRGAEALADSKAAVVMCDYRSQYKGVPTIYDAILGDDWHCFKLADTYKHAEVVKRGEHKKHAQEYVWTNRIPEYAERYLLLEDYKEKITIDEYWEKIRYSCENQLIPDKHIAEYCATYESLYDGKKLFTK